LNTLKAKLECILIILFYVGDSSDQEEERMGRSSSMGAIRRTTARRRMGRTTARRWMGRTTARRRMGRTAARIKVKNGIRWLLRKPWRSLGLGKQHVW
jgi:hypothetical protein